MLLMLRFFGMALILICTGSLGFSMARALIGREEELNRALAVIGGLESELRYSLAPPDEIVGRLEARESLEKAPYLPCCASLCRQGAPFPNAWKEAVRKNRGLMTLEDASILEALSDTLGQCDLEGQLSSIGQAKRLLEMQLENARARSASHAKLYRTLGLLAGAFLVVILL